MKKSVVKQPATKKPQKVSKPAKITKKQKKQSVKAKTEPVESLVTPSNVVTGYKHPGGRPPKYKTVPELENLIEAYFQSCWKQKIDMFGNPIFVKDKRGKKTEEKVMYQFKPYTITGLALAIGTTRETLIDYEKKDKFSDTIKRAKQMCQGYAEESLYIGKNPTGAIFNLKNNYGWKDKTETEHSGNLTWREEPPK